MRTHDYKRNGPTDLFVALNVATGEVLYDTKKRHTGKDMLAFFKYIDLHGPQRPRRPRRVGQPVRPHAPEVRKWLAHPRRERWHLHFTPTSSSWLNLVEGWFHLLTERRLRRGTFNSVEALIDAIDLWATLAPVQSPHVDRHRHRMLVFSTAQATYSSAPSVTPPKVRAQTPRSHRLPDQITPI